MSRTPSSCSCHGGSAVHGSETTQRAAGADPAHQDGVPFGQMRCLDRHYDVNYVTGQPSSTVDAGGWQRGELVRAAQPAFQLTSPGPMYDPTDPSTWRPGL